MPALPKPYRVAFLLPEVAISGHDSVNAHEAALLVWITCIEVCQRHPALAVYDAESTPLIPLDGHFRAHHAPRAPSGMIASRRDELVWLELALPRAGVVRLHTITRDGSAHCFEGTSGELGERIQHALGAWLASRGLAPLPRRFPPITSEDLLAAVRVLALPLAEQASASGLSWASAPESGPPASVAPIAARLAGRLPRALRVPALRLLQLALHEDTSELVLGCDPDHPQALFARYLATPERDLALLRRVLAAAPCWARPYGELVRHDDRGPDGTEPSVLESVAGAGIAILCRPGHLDVLETAAELLASAGLTAEAVRLRERAPELRARGHGALDADGRGGGVRLAAARAACEAGAWRRALEELWRLELTEPGRDAHVATSHLGRLLASAPLEVAEAAIGERLASGASSLARRMARDVADFFPGANASAVIARALGERTALELDVAVLDGFPRDTPGRQAIDALFTELAELGGDEVLARADQLVNGWLEVVFTEARDDEPARVARGAAYAAAQALGRYLAATTAPPSPMAGALRTVASEALALIQTHRAALGDRELRALFGTLNALLRRVDRWIGSSWLATVERSCGLDERAGGDLAGFAREHATVAARILGPEETAVLAASIARLHRERPARWSAAVYVQGAQLALHTGHLGADEWADAIVAQLAARELEVEDAIDALHTACYLAEGISAGPCVHAARVLLDAGRGAAAAVAVLAEGLGVAEAAWRDRQLAALASLAPELPRSFEELVEASRRERERREAVGETAAAARDEATWDAWRAALEDHGASLQVRARAAGHALAATIGRVDHAPSVTRVRALDVRAQAYLAGTARPSLDAQPPTPAATALIDRVVVPGSKLARISDYVALLRDLATLPPGEALAQFDLDEASYLELGATWGAAIEADPQLADAITAGLAGR